MHITVPTVHCTVQYRGEVAAPMTDLKECRIQEFQTRRIVVRDRYTDRSWSGQFVCLVV